MINNFKAYLILMIGIFCLLVSCKKTYHSYYTYGPIQAIGNQERLYVFLEIDRVVDKGKRYYDSSGSYPVGHKQELLIFDKDGLFERVVIKTNNNVDGVSVHPNLTTLFAYDKNVYVFSGESYSYKDSIFRWDSEKSKFLLLSIEEGQTLLNKFDARGSFSAQNTKLREVSKNAGWNFYYENTSFDKEELKWSINPLEITAAITGGNLEVLISMNHETKNQTNALTYPIQLKKLDTKEFEKLSREQHGHSK